MVISALRTHQEAKLLIHFVVVVIAASVCITSSCVGVFRISLVEIQWLVVSHAQQYYVHGI